MGQHLLTEAAKTRAGVIEVGDLVYIKDFSYSAEVICGTFEYAKGIYGRKGHVVAINGSYPTMNQCAHDIPDNDCIVCRPDGSLVFTNKIYLKKA